MDNYKCENILLRHLILQVGKFATLNCSQKLLLVLYYCLRKVKSMEISIVIGSTHV